MIRQINYQIKSKSSGQTVGAFLKSKGYSRSVVITLKTTKGGLTKNGEWTGVNEILQEGDCLVIKLVEKECEQTIEAVSAILEVLYEDEDLLVLNKPYNTPIHPSVNHYGDTLANQVMGYAKNKGESYPFRCINRLDRDTTGVTIIAKNQLSASLLGEAMSTRGLSRRYVALVEGHIDAVGVVNKPIGRAPNSIIKRQIDNVAGKQAITHYRREQVLDVEGEVVSLVGLRLETGRTHQIRVHMASIGHPLLGDFLYNETNTMLTRQALHGISCAFQHPITKEMMTITAPMPDDMRKLICT